MTTTISLADAESVTPTRPPNATNQPPHEARQTMSSWVLAFAEVLSQTSRGFSINPDNTSGNWAGLETLAASGTAFAVRPDPRYFVVDLDVDGLPHQAAQLRRSAFERLRWAAVTSKINHVLVLSGRPGHKHLVLLLGSSAPSVRDAIERQCREAGLDIRTRGVRPPLSPHRSGLRATVAGDLGEALAALRADPPGRSQLSALARELGLATLSRRMERVLREGHSAGGYESPSNGRMAFALAAVGAGYGREYIKTALVNPSNTLGETFRARKSHWQDAEVERLWSLAVERQGSWSAPRIESRKDALLRVAEWNASLDCDAWRGTSGGTDKGVCEALGRLAYSQGGIDFAAGMSVIAVAAGVCEATVRTSLKRIRERGWLRVIEAHTATTAARYRLLIPNSFRRELKAPNPQPPGGINASTGVPEESPNDVDLGSDVARWKAIGKPAMLAWRVLDFGQSTPVDSVAAALKISRTAARLRLRKLEQYGLATCTNGLWVRAFTDLDDLAAELGTLGERGRQVKKLLQNREARRTLRTIWSSAFRFFAREAHGNVTSAPGLEVVPEWISQSVPERILASWRHRVRVRSCVTLL